MVDYTTREVPQGEIVEMIFRGPTVMSGYYRDQEATHEAFRGTCFHGGDLVREGAEGFIRVVQRKKDVIIAGGENIYPAELDVVIATDREVADVAVIDVACHRRVETTFVVAVTKVGAGVNEDDLMALCRQKLARYKKQSMVVFVDALPRYVSGKVLKRLPDRAPDRFARARLVRGASPSSASRCSTDGPTRREEGSGERLRQV